jgi:DNA replication and repair protein RecF
MLIQRVELHGVRRIAQAEVVPAPGFNLFTGANGSGKSSLLEAIHLMAHGRSFRGRVRDGLIRQGDTALQVLLEWQAPPRPGRRAGLRHAGAGWEARMDGEPVSHLGALCEALAVVTFEPGSHALVDGSSEHRRRLLDWGLFHVERSDQHGGFLHLWRRHARALKQRNAVLRAGRPDPQLDAWEHELAQAGEQLTAQRELYVSGLETHLRAFIQSLLPAAGDVALSLQPGWRRQELSLADALLLGRDRDLAQGHTGLGPHRADLRIELRDLPGRQGLSRGQAKLVALSLLLAQAAHLAAHDGHWPVLQLDDLGSELDRDHQRRVLQVLADSGAQVLVTGTEPPPGLAGLSLDVARFPVEQGRISSLA